LTLTPEKFDEEVAAAAELLVQKMGLYGGREERERLVGVAKSVLDGILDAPCKCPSCVSSQAITAAALLRIAATQPIGG
jgi:hypothetical protein